MPGAVRDVLVTVGSDVSAGDRLVVLEAMKMEHTVTSPADGTVAEVLVVTGDQVDAGAVLIVLADDTDAAPA
jgi:3-methylcrotonyl-CoA carboxylase alpha subunit